MQSYNVLSSIESTAAHSLTPSAVYPLTRALLADTQSYYRSKVFISRIGINPLIAHSSVLLTLIPRLRNAASYPNLHTLQQHLIHEMKAFETQAQNHGYRAETVLIARYILCTVLDEAILSTHWGQQNGWLELSLLEVFQNETTGDERFFTLLTRLNEDPAAHIDSLELIYLCLSLGYQGPYRTTQNSQHSSLDAIRDDLYHRIRWQRGDIKKELLISILPKETKTPTSLYFPLWLVAAFTVTLSLTFYTGTTYLLSHSTASIYHQLAAQQDS